MHPLQNVATRNFISYLILGTLVFQGGPVFAIGADKGVAIDATQTRVTMDVRDADIKQVLNAFSEQTGLSLVVGKDVTGTVSVRLLSVPWDQALESILTPNGYGSRRKGDIIVILPLAQIKAMTEEQALVSRVFQLVFRDAGDILPVIEAQMSPRGRVQAVEETGQKGWDFGSFGGTGGGANQTSRSGVGSTSPSSGGKGSAGKRSRTKTLVVTDVPETVERIVGVIASLDVMPQQILIEARFMEVNRDRLKDFGVDLATGSNGASTAAVETVPLDKKAGSTVLAMGAQSLGALAAPAAFGAVSSQINKTNPFNTGLSMAFTRMSGTQFNILLHALEEDVHTNTLSAPSIMTLDNQEANILVGTQYPILSSSVAGTTSTTTVTSLDYYQDIGIQLRVVPQIAGNNRINMIVHPAVTSFSSTLSAKSPDGTTLSEYPILTTREAETQILMKDGETIVMGGMLREVKTKGLQKTPILGDIPILGKVFQRQTDDVGKIDLLIFLTARIVHEDQTVTHKPAFEPDMPGPETKILWKKEEGKK